MQITVGKILSLVIAVGYAVILIAACGVEGLKSVAVLLVPLALIWFPDELGSFTGYVVRGSYVNTETPPILLSIMGWLFLVGFPVLFWFLWS